MRKVFLSYCHRDDEPFGPKDQRWVETFEKALRETLGQRVGPNQVDLWRDKRRMDGATLFDREIELQLDESDLLVTVLSRHYLNSDYCRKEFRHFGEHKLGCGGLDVHRKSRILKVYRVALDPSDLHRFAELPELISEIDRSTGYHFFCTDENGGDRDALLDAHGMELVWQKADDLAKSIKEIIEIGGDPGQGAAPVPAQDPDRTVYLARTATDMRDVRDAVQRELEDRGYSVLPVGEPADDAETYAKAVRADLHRARMSIHLLAQRFGSTLEGSADSGVAMQAKLALEVEQRPFTTLFWSPPDLGAAEPAMQALVERIAELSIDPGRAEYVRAPLDQLKALTLNRLATPRPAPSRAATTPAYPSRSIYLVCDASDREDTRPLRDALKAEGFDVVRPALEGSADEMLAEHKTCLTTHDIVVIVWGKAREPWVRSKLRDLQQAPGWGRKNPFRARIVLVGPPDSPAKQDFDEPAGVVLLPAAESPAALLRLLQ